MDEERNFDEAPITAAERWLDGIDVGDSKATWEGAATLFREALTPEEWARSAGQGPIWPRPAAIAEARVRRAEDRTAGRPGGRLRRPPIQHPL